MSEETKSFESAITRLEEIVAKLEKGNCSLEESIKLFEEGTALSGLCRTKLDEAQQIIQKLQDQTDNQSEE